jgi:hypothetical protein
MIHKTPINQTFPYHMLEKSLSIELSGIKLDGVSEKQNNYAARIRWGYVELLGPFVFLKEGQEEVSEAFQQTLKSITSAKDWINNEGNLEDPRAALKWLCEKNPKMLDAVEKTKGMNK